jgi:hypothetical protein
VPRRARTALGLDSAVSSCERCGHEAHDLGAMPSAYTYLLGLYLGDGCISSNARGVHRLRIVLDAKYPGIIREAERAIREVMPHNKVTCQAKPKNCVEVYSYSKAWPCLVPQHGAGRKHRRRISLEPWQRDLIYRWPEGLVRGLIHSDGCRFMNTGRRWRHPRYAFCNLSEDIKAIFCETVGLLGLHCTRSGPKTIYVSRKADVAVLDRIVGPKR